MIKPKQQELAEAKAAEALWDSSFEKFKAVQEKLKVLVEELEAIETRKKKLEKEYEIASEKLEKA